MKSLLVFLSFFIIIFSSCNKDDDDNILISEFKFISGKVEFIAQGTSPETGFSIELKTPTDEIYYATVSDNSLIDTFTVGNNITLKGEATDNYLEVEKIISLDNENFQLMGTISSKEFNESGYSAEIDGTDNEIYQVEFSISNLGEQYKEFEIDDSINVSGSLLVFDKKLHLTAKTIN